MLGDRPNCEKSVVADLRIRQGLAARQLKTTAFACTGARGESRLFTVETAVRGCKQPVGSHTWKKLGVALTLRKSAQPCRVVLLPFSVNDYL